MIDWMTVIAQIINFLILVWLLKRFLYRPIIDAMDDREERIQARMQEADDKKEEAEEEKKRFHQKQKEFDNERDELRKKAEEEVEKWRENAMNEAKEDVNEKQEKWQDAIRDEQDEFFDDLRNMISERVFAISRDAIADLCHKDLQEQAVHNFIEELEKLNEDELEDLRQAIAKEDDQFVIRSAMKLEGDVIDELEERLGKIATNGQQPSYEVKPELLCGIELQTSDQRIAWNAKDYLKDLEEHVQARLSHELQTDDSDNGATD